VNLYIYALANPLRYNDYYGLRPCPDPLACLGGCNSFLNDCLEWTDSKGASCVSSGLEMCAKFQDSGQRAACEAGVRLSCRSAQGAGSGFCVGLWGVCATICLFPTGDTPCSDC